MSGGPQKLRRSFQVDEDTWEAVIETARKDGVSPGDIVRAAVETYIDRGDELRSDFDRLLTVCPPPKGTKVVLERVPGSELPGHFGDTNKYRNTFTIRIARGIDKYFAEFLLIHEYAHVKSWMPAHPLTGDHSPYFGVGYADVYCSYFGVK